MAATQHWLVPSRSNAAINTAPGGITAGFQARPEIVRLGGDQFLLTWLSAPEGTPNAVQAGIWNFSGLSLAMPGILTLYSAPATASFAPSAVRLTNGDVAIAFHQQGPGGTEMLRAVLDDATGNPVSAAGVFDQAGTINGPAGIATSGDGFVVVYPDNGWGSNEGTLAYFTANAGGPDYGMLDLPNGVAASHVEAVRLAGGNLAIVWREAASTALSLRILDAAGALVADRPNFDNFGTNGAPQLAALAGGGLAVVYADTGWDDADQEITAALFTASGANAAPGGGLFLRLTDNAVQDADPDIALMAGSGLVTVAWTQTNAGLNEIHAHLLEPDGRMISPTPVAVSALTPGQQERVSLAPWANDIMIFAWENFGTTADGSGNSIGVAGFQLQRRIDGSPLGETMPGSPWADVMFGNDGDDLMLGGAGNDILRGNFGNDTLRSGGGNDSMDGGIGNDVMVVDGPGFASMSEASFEGQDEAWIGFAGTSVSGEIEVLRLFGSATALDGGGISVAAQYVANQALGSLIQAGPSNDTLWGSALADSLYGGEGNDVIRSQGGADEMAGFRGDDQYVVSHTGARALEFRGVFEGTDTAWVTVNGWTVGDHIEIARLAAPGATLLYGNDTGMALVANPGAGSALYAGDGDDVLWGSGFDDTLEGGAGNDILRGQGGADVMAGGRGVDQYVVLGAGSLLLEEADGGFDIAYVGAGGGEFALGDHIEQGLLFGSATGLVGGANADYLVGNSSGLASTLRGGAGNDTLFGTAADDILHGGAGNDVIYAGGRQDLVVYGAGPQGFDLLSGFQQGGGLLDFRGSGVAFANLTLTTGGGNTQVQWANGTVLVFGVTGMTAADFLFT